MQALAALDNLFLAAQRARQGKSRRPDVEAWWGNRGLHLAELRERLRSGSWAPGPYRTFEIFESKRRLISAAPFADRVVHHALCNLLAPILERQFIARSYSCQRQKGTTAARECCRKLVNRHRYVLKCDVRKFFPNIDHALLLEKLATRVDCPGVMEIITRILNSHRTGPEIPAAAFPGDDWVEAVARPRGLPIGNLTSQLWANFYLDGFDHWMTEMERQGAYLRYTDDFLIFGGDKPTLWALRSRAAAQLAGLRLKLAEPKSRLLQTAEGVPFCGFRFLPGQRPRILGPTKRRFEKRRFTLGRKRALAHLSQAVFAWYQFSREGNSEGLRRAYARWPLDARLKRRRRQTSRVLRGASWNNNNPGDLLSSYRNHNQPDNRNDNIGLRVVLGGAASKAEDDSARGDGSCLSHQDQEISSLTAAPAPVRETGQDAAAAVAGKQAPAESHGRPGGLNNPPDNLFFNPEHSPETF